MERNQRYSLDTKMTELISDRDSKIFWNKQTANVLFTTRKDFEWRFGQHKKVI